MRHSVARALGLALAVATFAACASPVEETLDAPARQAAPSDVGAIGAAGAAAEDTAAAATPVTTMALPSTTSLDTTSTTRAVPTTRAPSSTSAPRQTAPPTTEAEVVGDGPMLTVPAGGGVEESPAIGDGPRPAFFALSAETIVKCAKANPGTVRLTWEVIGAETVDIAVGTSSTILSADQPPAGTLDVSLDCAKGSRYFVVAANPEGETIRSVSVSPG